MKKASIQRLIAMAVDLEDRLALREFAQLEWHFAGEVDPSKTSLMRSSADRRYSWMRMMHSRGRSLPRPAGGSSRAALYRLGDLVDWVQEHDNSDVVFDSRWAVWRASRAFADDQAPNTTSRDPTSSDVIPLDTLRRFLVGLVLLCAPDGHLSVSAAVEKEILRGGNDLPARLRTIAAHEDTESGLLASRLIELMPAVRSSPLSRAARSAAAVLLSGDASPSSLVDQLFEHLSGLAVRAGATTTGQSLSRLVAGLGDPKAGERVVDPACGEGQILLAAARLRGSTDLVGRDSDGDALLTARAVFKINGISADFGDGPADSLAGASELPVADLVLLDPPLGGGLHVAKWLKLAAELTPAGRAVVVLPGDSLRSGRREWPSVAERVESVIACPPKVRSDTGQAPAAWVLGQSHKDKVLVVDASSTQAHTFDVKNADRLVDATNAWGRAGRWDPPSGVRGRVIPRAAIDAAGGELRLDILPTTPDWLLEPDGKLEAAISRSTHTGFRLRPRTRKLLHLLFEELNEDPSSETEDLRAAIANFLNGIHTNLN
jgi:SAM-dependent methyltransferase